MVFVAVVIVVVVVVVVVVLVVVELVDEEDVIVLVLGNLSPVSNGEQSQVQNPFHQSLMASNENEEKDIVLCKISCGRHTDFRGICCSGECSSSCSSSSCSSSRSSR